MNKKFNTKLNRAQRYEFKKLIVGVLYLQELNDADKFVSFVKLYMKQNYMQFEGNISSSNSKMI